MRFFGLAAMSGVLLGFAFFTTYTFPIIFFALLPSLYALEEKKNRSDNVLCYLSLYTGLVVWHFMSNYWLMYAVVRGTILINIINPLLYTVAFIAYDKTCKRNKFIASILFICAWICIEYLHNKWQLCYVLNHFGNTLGHFPVLAQWYEYTGVLGGSLWILSTNLALFHLMKYRTTPMLLFTCFILVIPTVVSYLLYIKPEQIHKATNVLLLHPNTDPETERKNTPVEILADKYLHICKQEFGTRYDFVVWPENCLQSWGRENDIRKDKMFQDIRKSLSSNGGTEFVTGCVQYEICKDTLEAAKNGWTYKKTPIKIPYLTRNGVVAFDTDKMNIKLRAKQKLVPVEETIPYPKILWWIRNVSPSLGGFSFSPYKNQKSYFETQNKIRYSPIVCYESGFGELVGNMANSGSQLFFVLLNEGWYKNIHGASLIQNLSKLRAIETRKYYARSSNYGISSIISTKGEVVYATSNFSPSTLDGTVYLNDTKTFYAKYGDWVGKVALGGLLLCVALLLRSRLMH